MKKFAILCLMLSLGTASSALAAGVNCNEISKLAGSIMRARQDGKSLKYMLDRSQGNEGVEKLIHRAYKTNQVFIEDWAKDQAVKDFTRNIYGECWRQNKK